MRRFLLLVIFVGYCTIALCTGIISGKVIKVADGDTFTILLNNKKTAKVRLDGVDCPEQKQDFGTKAKQFTSLLCFGKIVWVEVSKKDRYGRYLGKAKLPNGKVLNEELLKAGLAWHFTRYDKSQLYRDLEKQARMKKLGIWSTKNQLPPWEFRSKRK